MKSTTQMLEARTSSCVCPRCGSRDLRRIQRRSLDRLLHLVRPVYRFECEAFGCQWEGTLRQADFGSRSWHLRRAVAGVQSEALACPTAGVHSTSL